MVWYKGHFLLDFVCVVPCVNHIRMDVGAKNIRDSTKAQINRFWFSCKPNLSCWCATGNIPGCCGVDAREDTGDHAMMFHVDGWMDLICLATQSYEPTWALPFSCTIYNRGANLVEGWILFSQIIRGTFYWCLKSRFYCTEMCKNQTSTTFSNYEMSHQ